MFTTSCLKQSESITPIADVRTLAQLQHESMMSTALMAAGNNALTDTTQASVQVDANDSSLFYLNLRYNIINMDLYDTSDVPNSFEQIGNSLLKVFAKIFLKMSGSRTVKIGNINLPITDLNLDFNIIKSLKVKRVFLKYNKDYDQTTGNKANFSFINFLNISKTNGNNPQILSYEKSQNRCQFKCLDFKIINGDIFELAKNNKAIPLKPSLSIKSLPDVEELRLDGQIDLQIGLKLPF